VFHTKASQTETADRSVIAGVVLELAATDVGIRLARLLRRLHCRDFEQSQSSNPRLRGVAAPQPRPKHFRRLAPKMDIHGNMPFVDDGNIVTASSGNAASMRHALLCAAKKQPASWHTTASTTTGGIQRSLQGRPAASRHVRVGLRRERRRCRRARDFDSTTAGRLTRQCPSRLCPSRLCPSRLCSSRQRPSRQSDWSAASKHVRVGLRRERRRSLRDRTSHSTTIGRLARQRLSRQCPSRQCRSGAGSWVTSASRALLCRRAAPVASRQRGLPADAGRLCRSSATSRRLMRRVASRSRPRRG
jgi:hypothetical protein